MANDDTGFGAKLYDLWRAGRDGVPTVAQEYVKANQSIANTHDNLDAAFFRPQQFGGHGVRDQWKLLRDELQGILGRTARNLDLVGEALRLNVTEYIKADSEAEDGFKKIESASGEISQIKVGKPSIPPGK